MDANQKSTIRWTRVAVGISILAAIFICGQWYEMHTAARDTHDLAGAAKSQADATSQIAQRVLQQNRPWVGMQGQLSWSQLSLGNGISTLVVGYTLKNFGASPALNTVASLERPVADVNNYALIKAKVNESCQSAERLIAQTGDLLLPSAEKPDTWKSTDRHPTKLVVPGCIVYRDTMGGIHHTQLCYWIDLAEKPKPDTFSTCWFQSAD